MAIEVISGKVNVNGELKETGARLKMSEADEKRLVDLGYAKPIEEKEATEIEDFQETGKKGAK
jgi:hypothetical protein